jgi:hypothetical protein
MNNNLDDKENINFCFYLTPSNSLNIHVYGGLNS